MKGMSMSTLTTADQLFERPDDGNRYELVKGELHMMSPSGWKHGQTVGILHTLLGGHIRKNRLGEIFGAETGFRLAENPDTVRAPDIAFIAKKNLPEHEPQEGFWPGAPDLAIEVLSPSDRAGQVAEKIQAWLDAGVTQVWIVDPRLKTIAVYRSTSSAVLVAADQQLDLGDILSGFVLDMSEVFED